MRWEYRNDGNPVGVKSEHPGGILVRSTWAVDPADAWVSLSMPERRVKLTPAQALSLAEAIRVMALEAAYED